MSNSPDFVAHVLELMRPTAQVTSRAMFGGHGLYADGVFFAILDDDTLYLKSRGKRPAPRLRTVQRKAPRGK